MSAPKNVSAAQTPLLATSWMVAADPSASTGPQRACTRRLAALGVCAFGLGLGGTSAYLRTGGSSSATARAVACEAASSRDFLGLATAAGGEKTREPTYSVVDDNNPWCVTPGVPQVKCVVSSMDAHLNTYTFDYDKWAPYQRPYWAGDGEDMQYITNWTPDGKCLNTANGLREWFDHEHVPFNIAFRKHSWTQMMNIGEDFDADGEASVESSTRVSGGRGPATIAGTGSTTTYANLEWSGSLCGIELNGDAPRGIVRIWDFYHLIRDDQGALRIKTNWMMLDLPLLMAQSLGGRSVLPKPPGGIHDGDLVLLPRGVDGVPAPIYYARQITKEEMLVVKNTATFAVAAALGVSASPVALNSDSCVVGLSKYFQADLQFSGSMGVGVTRNLADFCNYVRRPLLRAFEGAPRFEVDTVACEQRYCAFHGHLAGRRSSKHVWMDEPAATAKVASSNPAGTSVSVGDDESNVSRLRVGLHARVDAESGQVGDLYFMADVPKWYNDAGENLWDRMKGMQFEK